MEPWKLGTAIPQGGPDCHGCEMGEKPYISIGLNSSAPWFLRRTLRQTSKPYSNSSSSCSFYVLSDAL
jgi:hypothetical protein